MESQDCVVFLLIDDDKLLLEKRSDAKEFFPGKIAIPGGHIEQGESKTDALYREIKEELDIVPDTYFYLCSLHQSSSELKLFHYYVVESWQGDIRALEADSVAWHLVASAPVDIEADKVALSEYQRLHPHLNPVNGRARR